ncbi:hypothetical protein ACFYW9_40945 [Streptomyces sp. NPDC002698]|uniref:hypothetical protein n=1 Tax=Streptomyces sp. NPDC002698 TaxID=3364660 RepID=UPI00368501A9
MTTDPQYPLTAEEAATEAARLIRAAYEQPAGRFPATSFRDTTPVPAIGSTPPVPQPDSRIVPAWALGVAVASVGVGAGVTGVGCGAWLVLQGLSSVTLLGVLAIVAPFAGVAMVATAVGSVISRARRSATTNVYQGTVIQSTEITSTAKGLGARSQVGGEL